MSTVNQEITTKYFVNGKSVIIGVTRFIIASPLPRVYRCCLYSGPLPKVVYIEYM